MGASQLDLLPVVSRANVHQGGGGGGGPPLPHPTQLEGVLTLQDVLRGLWSRIEGIARVPPHPHRLSRHMLSVRRKKNGRQAPTGSRV